MHVSLLSPYPLIHLLPSIVSLLLISMRKVTCPSQSAQDACFPALTLSLVSPFAVYYAQSHLSKSTCARMHVSLLAPYPWFHLLLITMRKVTCRSQRAQETRFPVLTLSLVSPFANYHAQSHLSRPTFTGCMFPSSHLIP